MTTSYDWPTTRDHGIDAFGESPGAQLEERVLAHFRERPRRVVTLIESLAVRVREGQIRHGWAILDRELAVIPAEVQVDDNQERARMLRLAEHWMRHAGGYLSADEILDTLFGDIGGFNDKGASLRAWPELRDHMLKLYESQRPRFEKCEQEADERLARQAETLRRVRKGSGAATPGGEQAQLIAGVDADGGASASSSRADVLAYYDTLELPDDESEAAAT